MRKNIINPMTLKGKESLSRIKQLMGESIDKNTKNFVIELTKKGPDGNVYAIVRENHQYFIKVTDKTNNIIAEDFKYVGGLQNKTLCAYPSYAKAIKQLNLKFINLSEAYDSNMNIDTFTNDNLVNESNAIGAAGWGFATESVFEDEDEMKEAVEEALDKVGDEDCDIDNDGEENDENDLYIKNKRLSIGKAIQGESTYVVKKKL